MEEIQPGIFEENGNLYTRNAAEGETVYGESLRSRDGEEYRAWHAKRSKAAAAVKNGVELGIQKDEAMLYLGAASGTTVSHFSDILASGFIYAVEYSETVARDLVKLAETRENIAPIIGDARKPPEYSDIVQEKVDVVFQDISQRDQAEIFLRNAEKFLADGGTGLIAVKARSISSSDDLEEIFRGVKDSLEEKFEIVDETRLEPFEKEHLFIKMKKR